MEKTAHKIEEKERTDDVKLSAKVPFSKMVLFDPVRKGLRKAGYVYPTVIQANAINLGKAGIDLVVQSKSGTGKTLIFATVLLESYRSDTHEPQSLILAPTREIAVQIESTLNTVGCYINTFKAVSVIGGLDVVADRKKIQNASAVVGTPGRVLHLIQNNVFNTSKLSLLVVDEADKMMSQTFRKDFDSILKSIPRKLQIIACSATYNNDLDKELAKLMRNPLLISTERQCTVLLGIKQFVYELPEESTNILQMNAKLAALKHIFSSLSFKQCLVFTNSQSRGESYRNLLEKEQWSCEAISGAQDQKIRLEKFKKFREFKTRILIATDLMSRGVDSEHVNLVINLDIPADEETYLHRIGRAGRFGSHGIAITLISSKKEDRKFSSILSSLGEINILKFPKNCKLDLWNFSNFDEEAKTLGLYEINKDKENNNSPPKSVNRRNSLHEVEALKTELYNEMIESNRQEIIDKNYNLFSDFKRAGKDDEKDSSESQSMEYSSQQVGKTSLKNSDANKGSLVNLLFDNKQEALQYLFDDYEKTLKPQTKKKSKEVRNEESPSAQIKNKMKNFETFEDLKEQKIDYSTVHKEIRNLLTNSSNDTPSLDIFESFESSKSIPVDQTQQVEKVVLLSHNKDSSEDATLGAIPSLTPTDNLNTISNVEAKSKRTKSKVIPQPSTSTSEPHRNLSPNPENHSPPSPSPEEQRNVTPVNAQLEQNPQGSDSDSSAYSGGSSQRSSGFDERTTSARSSGVVTTDTSESDGDSEDDSDDYSLSSPDESSDTLKSANESSSDCEPEGPRQRKRNIRKKNGQGQCDPHYYNNYMLWTHMYWRQKTQIQDYIRFCKFARENACNQE